ncbi:phosphodiesterase/alkaline phosphatase D-like protein [Reticulomyxa filosa]|uniref:Phosphodiesterase/alkaline phosphatase D-like protein n=1 Tax=Reticulomyxa filosa TaxID=46433 RepID=X6P7P8_RETFI|nr:phosphodiesterase/alkaline phosphatase D-like protein [Reticulomyxa filosa]|eukprot:ETO34545.1 phosphodiesterase/alkaline phosphatase D-like protein [Reticulomyxa filosa]
MSKILETLSAAIIAGGITIFFVERDWTILLHAFNDGVIDIHTPFAAVTGYTRLLKEKSALRLLNDVSKEQLSFERQRTNRINNILTNVNALDKLTKCEKKESETEWFYRADTRNKSLDSFYSKTTAVIKNCKQTDKKIDCLYEQKVWQKQALTNLRIICGFEERLKIKYNLTLKIKESAKHLRKIKGLLHALLELKKKHLFEKLTMWSYLSNLWFLTLLTKLFLLAADSSVDIEHKVRINFGSCTKPYREQPLWPYILARHPDLWIWGGDIVYHVTLESKINKQTNKKLANRCNL